MQKFQSIFKVDKPIIGMIHLKALPGTPKFNNNINEIIDAALHEVEIYKSANIDALAIENMHDVPYLKNDVGHEISSIMSIIAHEVKKLSGLPCGIQVLSSANKAALAIAKNAGLDFIRAEGFVFGHVADEGYIDANAGELLRYRKTINADHIAVFTDIKKKHSSHAITADVDIVETAKAAEFFLSDGLIVTGISTGESANIDEIKSIKKTCKIPVIVGSGITLDNLTQYLPSSDALIVGSYFKKDGYWANELEQDKIARFMDKVNALRS
ncbi:MAG: BtpA/SgcQ family protein [Flavobacteriaceae bacterium]|nr:BtpA/SgcQ family protein [Flavobacteriaceae bacterium]